MSDYREIEIIASVIGKDNLLTGERWDTIMMRVRIAVSEYATLNDVAEEVKHRLLTLEDVL